MVLASNGGMVLSAQDLVPHRTTCVRHLLGFLDASLPDTLHTVRSCRRREGGEGRAEKRRGVGLG